MDLEEIRAKIKLNEYDLSQHAHLERQVEHITVKEVEQTVLYGEIIESYTKDPRGENCLIGARLESRDLYSVW